MRECCGQSERRPSGNARYRTGECASGCSTGDLERSDSDEDLAAGFDGAEFTTGCESGCKELRVGNPGEGESYK